MTDTKRPQITGRVDGSLRDRIAAVQAKHLLVRYDRRAWWCQCGDDCLSVEGSHSLHVADAVIRELGWREEKAVKNSAFKPPLINTYATPEAAVDDIDRAPPHVKQDLRLVHRYVTEWTTE
jgi:hypothetical protein